MSNNVHTKYDLIYSDPPWKQKKGGIRKVRPNQTRKLDYKTLSIQDIKEIHEQYNASTIFVWTIDKFLHETETTFTEMGYKLHARIIWDKENGIAPAFTVRFSHEYLLWFYKSPMPKIAVGMRGKYTTVIREKSVKHSKKPISAYKMIENLYPDAKKIELFARNSRHGWDAFGDEL